MEPVQAPRGEEVGLKVKWVRCRDDVRRVVSRLLPYVEPYLGGVTIVVTSSIDVVHELADPVGHGLPFVGVYVDGKIPGEDEVVSGVLPLVKGMDLLYVPAPQQASVMHELGHVVAFEAVDYRLIGIAKARKGECRESVLKAFWMLDSFLINPVNDVVADVISARVFPRYRKFLEAEDFWSHETLREHKDSTDELLAATCWGLWTLLVGHSGLTKTSMAYLDEELRSLRERFSESLNRRDASRFARRLVEKHVTPLASKLGFRFSGFSTTRTTHGYTYDIAWFEVVEQ